MIRGTDTTHLIHARDKREDEEDQEEVELRASFGLVKEQKTRKKG